MTTIHIGSVPVGPDQPPVIIAEMSGNHNGSLDRALDIVRAVADAGAQTLKLQTYTADTITIDSRHARVPARPTRTAVGRPDALRPVHRGVDAVGVARADLRPGP